MQQGVDDLETKKKNEQYLGVDSEGGKKKKKILLGNAPPFFFFFFFFFVYVVHPMLHALHGAGQSPYL